MPANRGKELRISTPTLQQSSLGQGFRTSSSATTPASAKSSTTPRTARTMTSFVTTPGSAYPRSGLPTQPPTPSWQTVATAKRVSDDKPSSHFAKDWTDRSSLDLGSGTDSSRSSIQQGNAHTAERKKQTQAKAHQMAGKETGKQRGEVNQSRKRNAMLIEDEPNLARYGLGSRAGEHF